MSTKTANAEMGQVFHFVQSQDAADTREVKRRARSHAVKRALERKRKLQADAQDNFRIVASEKLAEDSAKKQGRVLRVQMMSRDPAAGTLDPFEVLAVDSRRFQKLLYDRRARQASEPVFSVIPDCEFQSFQAVFQGGLDDPALGNAVMLMLTLSIAEGAITNECLRYQSLALGELRERMGSIEKATSLGTMGTILFLAGVEARLGMREHVQTHLQAIQRLLEIGRTRGVYLTAGMKRAMFWQDLNASIMTGSKRIMDHNTFVELHWQRDPFAPHFHQLPSGFSPLASSLGTDLTAVLEDVHALQHIRNRARHIPTLHPLETAYINNHQASIQSRLVDMTDLSPLLDCVRLTAYLCSSILCCRVWCGKLIPEHLSAQLLNRLQAALAEDAWADSIDLLRWVVCIGASFATSRRVRQGFKTLVKDKLPSYIGEENYAKFMKPEPSLGEAMGSFIWSTTAFSIEVHSFWDEVVK